MATVQTQTTKFAKLLNAYSSLRDMIRTDLPNIDVDLALKLLMESHKYQNALTRVRLEIVYSPNINAKEKKDAILAKTGRSAEIREGHILIIDGYFRLNDIEDLAKDSQIKTIGGDIIY